MDYREELLRRVLGVEMPIRLHSDTIPTPAPQQIYIPTKNASRQLRMTVEFGHNRMSVLLFDWDGAPLWIRHFEFEVEE